MTMIQVPIQKPLDIPNLSKSELKELIQAQGELQQDLFRQAREVRQQAGVDEVLLRGVIEISNYCQKNCDYCAMRAANPKLNRYRMAAEEILEIADQIAQMDISILFLQAGQDPQSDSVVEEVIPEIKRRYNFPVLLCMGERPQNVYQRFAQLGADSYILKFEVSNPELHRDIIHTPLERRLQCLRWLQEAGFEVGTGNIVGLRGQTLDHLVEDIRLALEIQPNFVSSSPFIPNQDTPLENIGCGNLDYTLNTMAIYRIALKTPLIPTVSALEKIQPDGQLMGLNAGANVMTINFTPPEYREKYSIYSKKRFIVSLDHALNTIERAGLRLKVLS
ncbi:radical SAM protein [Crocosphaera chwakensis]|uniref:Biotin synthase n=1 Tax=Crocosphaera chwakensis CCY0110 TaxID=391612 RepID=A3ILM0_9CHRO|nr:radical SAM protein [Crocosphaera chwakensis]EAZ92671.1 biotin synthase [Crocosphaera chwakensis CCY0110]